jgi:hypothetical protein
VVSGVTRWRRRLDYITSELTERPAHALEPAMRTVRAAARARPLRARGPGFPTGGWRPPPLSLSLSLPLSLRVGCLQRCRLCGALPKGSQPPQAFEV